jgi:hypothetical protein
MYRLLDLGQGRRLVLALAIAGATFGIASAVQASIPDAKGVIHGCYNTSLAHGSPTGALRVIDTATVNGSCASWETPLNWNQRGVTGPTGPRGPTGARGPTGPPGTARAWALVRADGTIVQQVNVTSVSHNLTGAYCVFLNGINASTVAAVATAIGGLVDRDVANTTFGCGNPPTGIQVAIWNTGTNLNQDSPFSIVIP